MKIIWKVSAADVAHVKALIITQKANPIVRLRQRINCSNNRPSVDKNSFWKQMVSMRLTSQQKSGPNDPVGRFNHTVPFPLNYESICNIKTVRPFIAKTLRTAHCKRFVETIADQLGENLEYLEQGGWTETLMQCNRLTKNEQRTTEVDVANYIQAKFKGFGPKQSRNLLQALGLTRFEIPIDSRVTDWLNEFGFPLHLSATALADINYYSFVSDGIQVLCKKCEVLPCIFDAAVFVLKDGDTWTDENAF